MPETLTYLTLFTFLKYNIIGGLEFLARLMTMNFFLIYSEKCLILSDFGRFWSIFLPEKVNEIFYKKYETLNFGFCVFFVLNYVLGPIITVLGPRITFVGLKIMFSDSQITLLEGYSNNNNNNARSGGRGPWENTFSYYAFWGAQGQEKRRPKHKCCGKNMFKTL